MFNGEIYNHLELRKSIVKQFGSDFWNSISDIETLRVLVDCYSIPELMSSLEGMYSIVIWDTQEKKLYLCRDRFGEKPLYYGFTQQKDVSLLFASELKSLIRHPDFTKDLRPSSVCSFFAHGYVPVGESIYQGVYQVRPGNFMEFSLTDIKKGGRGKCFNYWDIEKTQRISSRDIKKYGQDAVFNKFDSLICRSVSRQLLSEVPLGAFLSGGLDSSLIVALMQEQSPKSVKTFTIGFEDGEYNEANHAKVIAEYLGTDHSELVLQSKDALDLIPRLSQIYDEPFADSSQVPTIVLSKFARDSVTVALTGDGGDEICAGYNRHLLIHRHWPSIQSHSKVLRKQVAKLITLLPERFLNRLFNYIPILNNYPNMGEKLQKLSLILPQEEIEGFYNVLTQFWGGIVPLQPDFIVSQDASRAFSKHDELLDDLHEILLKDIRCYLTGDILTKVDRASMSASLETRAPFLDKNVAEFAWSLPSDIKVDNTAGKVLTRHSLYKRIPQHLVDRPKQGFSMPIDQWLRSDLRSWVESSIADCRSKTDHIIRVEIIEQKWADHLSGKKNNQSELWTFLMFQSWYNEYMCG